MAKSGYALDTKPTGFGLVELPYHASSAYSDPLTDHLYLVLDQNNEPTDGALPLASTAVAATGKTIFQFDGDAASNMVYRWRGKLNLFQHPKTPHMGRVRALSYANLIAKFYGDGVLLLTKVITSAKEFKLPALKAFESYEMELIGTSTSRSIQAAEDVTELT